MRYFLSCGDPVINKEGRIVGISAPVDGDRIVEVNVCEFCGVLYVPDPIGSSPTHAHQGEF